jgi:hypothetical protein
MDTGEEDDVFENDTLLRKVSQTKSADYGRFDEDEWSASLAAAAMVACA